MRTVHIRERYVRDGGSQLVVGILSHGGHGEDKQAGHRTEEVELRI